MNAGIKLPASADTSPSTQAAAHASVLAWTLQHTTLPLLVWTVFPSGLFGRAVGATDLDVVAAVLAWANASEKPISTLSLPTVVERRGALGTEWRIEPGRIEAELSPSVTVGGDLVTLMPEIEAEDDRLAALKKALRGAR